MDILSTFEFSDKVVGFIIDRDINSEVVDQIHALIEERLKEQDKLNLYVEIQAGNEISFTAFFEDFKFKIQHSNDFYKIAVVTNLEWFKHIAFLEKIFMNSEIKSFSLTNRIEAINWISQ